MVMKHEQVSGPLRMTELSRRYQGIAARLSLFFGGKHVKYKRTPPPKKMTPDEQKEMVQWCKSEYPQLRPKLRELWGDMRDYYLMQGEAGNQINWPACFRRWVRRAAKPYVPAQRGSYEMPAEHKAPGKKELAIVRSILGGGKKKA